MLHFVPDRIENDCLHDDGVSTLQIKSRSELAEQVFAFGFVVPLRRVVNGVVEPETQVEQEGEPIRLLLTEAIACNKLVLVGTYCAFNLL